MEKSAAQDRKQRRPLLRRLSNILFRRPPVQKHLCQVELTDHAIWEIKDHTNWEMSAHDALRIPLTEFARKNSLPAQSKTTLPTGADPNSQDGTAAEIDSLHSAQTQELGVQPIHGPNLDEDHDLPSFERVAIPEPGLRPKTEKPQANSIKSHQRTTVVSKPESIVTGNEASNAKAAQNKGPSSHDNAEANSVESPFIPQLNHPTPMSSSIEKAGARLTHLVKGLPSIEPEVLPISAKPTTQAAPANAQSTRNKHDTVLLIEPNPKVRQALHAMVKSLGVRCMAVGTAKEALNFMHRIQPSVVLLEQNIRDMTTTELIICIRRLYRHRPVPVVLMEEADNQLYSECTLRLSVEAHLTKPFNPHGLAQAIAPYASVKVPDTNAAYIGAVGLVIEQEDLRHYLRRMLVRHNYTITMSCNPERLKFAGNLLKNQQLDAWLVQADDEDICANVVDYLESSFSSPVYVGFDDLNLEACSDMDKLRWKGRLLQKLGKLIESKAAKIA